MSSGPVSVLSACIDVVAPFYSSTLEETSRAPGTRTRRTFSSVWRNSQCLGRDSFKNRRYGKKRKKLTDNGDNSFSFRSSYRNSSLVARLLMPPQLVLVRKSTGEVTCGVMGNLRKKSSSPAVTSFRTNKIWKAICDAKISLSHSKSPLLVYVKTEYVMHSIRLCTLAATSAAGSAFRIAFWKTTLNAFSENW